MIKNISIKNFKTIESLNIELGRVTVLIGENGAGKSNILEAITLAGASSSNKLDNEFLQSRGVRVNDSRLMRSAFSSSKEEKSLPIEIVAESDSQNKAHFVLTNDNQPYSKWECEVSYTGDNDSTPDLHEFIHDIFMNNAAEGERRKEIAKSLKVVFKIIERARKLSNEDKDSYIRGQVEEHLKPGDALFDHFMEHSDRINEIGIPLANFITYSPENTQLRREEVSSTIEPLGIKGEGLLKLLYVISQFGEEIELIKRKLKLLGWFSDFVVKEETSGFGLEIKDLYLEDPECTFDQNAANEGFMFLLFYFTILVSPVGPTFFAIDNIDTSLNPKLCQRLVKEIVELAKEKKKQVILTTHNPAVLDGLNLDDEDQKLYAISRSRNGRTKATRIQKPRKLEGAPDLRLSEMFLRGLIGGLPKGF